MRFLDQVLWGNSVSRWLVSLGVGGLVFLVLWLVKRLLLRRAVALTDRTRTELDDLVVDVLNRSWALVLVALSLWAASLTVHVPSAESTIGLVLWALVLVQLAILGNGVIGYFVARWSDGAHGKGDSPTAAAYKTLGMLAKVMLWAGIALLILDSIPGVEVNTLIAGMGVGGIAVALALQAVLGDVFASVSILLDKPFEVGDFISMGDYSGTVEYIGLKSTRLRSLSGEQIILGNSDLLGSRIRNYKRMQDRRVSFTIGVASETPYEKLVAIPKMLQGIVEAQADTQVVWARFANYGDFSLNFEVVYKMLTVDYNRYIEVQQAINLAIYKRFGEEGITLPYPTQTIYLRSSGLPQDQGLPEG